MAPKKADGERVIIVDEFAEIEAADPTFAGMRTRARLEEAYARVRKALLDAYERRFRHQAPASDVALYQELERELVIPHEALIRKLVYGMKEEQRLSAEDEEAILAVVEEFLARIGKA